MQGLYTFLGKVIVEIINPVILLLSATAFVVFLWGGFEFVMHAGDATKRKEGKDAIVWGLVGLVIIFGAYSIINVVTRPFDIKPVSPQLPTQPGG